MAGIKYKSAVVSVTLLDKRGEPSVSRSTQVWWGGNTREGATIGRRLTREVLRQLHVMLYATKRSDD